MKLVLLAAGEGSRLKEFTNGIPKQLIKFNRKTILDQFLEISNLCSLEPAIITQKKFKDYFSKSGAEVYLQENVTGAVLDTLFYLKKYISEEFAWIMGDMIFTNLDPFAEIVNTHFFEDFFCSTFYSKGNISKAKYVPGDPPRVVLSHEPKYAYSLLNFMIQKSQLLDLIGTPANGEFMNLAIARGCQLPQVAV